MKPLTIVAAGLAAGTNAFLLPPGALSDIPGPIDDKAFKALPLEVAVASESQLVEVDCPGCPIVVKGQMGRFRVKHGSSHLNLAFEVDHAASSDRLLVNGFELYPESDPVSKTLAAAVMPEFDEADDGMPGGKIPMSPKSISVENQQLGFSLMSRTVKKDQETGTELVSLDLQILEIGNIFVSGLSTVHVDLLKGSGNSLMIAKIEQVPAVKDTPRPNTPCKSMACKWKALVNEYIKHFKPAFSHCAGKMGMGKVGYMSHGHTGDHHQHHHQQQGDQAAVEAQYHRMHHHSWARLMKKFSYTILLPILVGIVAGVSVSVIGMVVGTVIIGLWRVFVRGQPFFRARCRRRSSSRAGHACHKAAQAEAAVSEEKSGLMDNQGAPPSYEEADGKAEA